MLKTEWTCKKGISEECLQDTCDSSENGGNHFSRHCTYIYIGWTLWVKVTFWFVFGLGFNPLFSLLSACVLSNEHQRLWIYESLRNTLTNIRDMLYSLKVRSTRLWINTSQLEHTVNLKVLFLSTLCKITIGINRVREYRRCLNKNNKLFP